MEERQVTGICKFCGQVTALGNVAALRERELSDPDYWATRSCTCREAQAFANQEMQRELKEKQREHALADALKLIETKLGPTAAKALQGRAFPELDYQVRALFNAASGLVYDGIIDVMTATAVDGSTIKMYLDGKTGSIEVRRKQTLEI